MTPTRKNFIIGFVSGIIFSILILVTIVAAYYFIIMPKYGEIIIEKQLRTPEFPTVFTDDCLSEANYDLKLSSLNKNDTLELSKYRGSIIFLSFWEEWCLPCLAEMNSIKSLSDKTENLDIKFLLVSSKNTEKVKKIVEKKGINLPFYTILQDSLSTSYKIGSFPTTYIITPNGKVAFKHKKAAKWDSPKAINFLKSINNY